MISKGFLRSMSYLALTKAFLVSATRTEEEDLVMDGLIPKDTIVELQAMRHNLADRINTFLESTYRGLSHVERLEAKRINNRTVTKALALIKHRLIDMDYVAIYLLKKLDSMDNVSTDIKALVDLDELAKITVIIEKTYKGEFEKKKYISKFEHIALVKKIFES